jgi:predicted DNA-binding protein (MmcQ/YjbR family)
MGLIEIITGEMLLVPGVEAHDSGRDDFELRVGGKAFAHIHQPDRIDVRLPPDVKENVLARGMASRSPEPHDKEGWVTMKLGQNADFQALTRLLHQSYRFTSSML